MTTALLIAALAALIVSLALNAHLLEQRAKRTPRALRRAIRACEALRASDVWDADEDTLRDLVIATSLVANLAEAERIGRRDEAGGNHGQ
jgi:hypothetical protein